MYAINDRSSFEDAEMYIQQIERTKDVDAADVPCMVVGNKLDLAPNERVVSTAELHKLARKYNIKCAEASAKNNANVNHVFEDVVMMVLKYRAFGSLKQEKPKPSKQCITM